MDRAKRTIEGQPHRLRWHALRWFAALAIGFCTYLLGLVVGLVAAGPDFVETWPGGIGAAAMWGTVLVSLPLVYRRLRS